MSSKLRSRDGCVTCKSKRQKCDETRPRCLRCQRAKISCGGYPKAELRWRSVNKTKISTASTKNSPRSDSRPNVANLHVKGYETPAFSENWQEECSTANSTSPDDSSITSVEPFRTTFMNHSPDPNEPLVSDALIMAAFEFPLDLALFDISPVNTHFDQLNAGADDHVGDGARPATECPTRFGPWASEDGTVKSNRSNLTGTRLPNLSQLRPSNRCEGMLLVHFEQRTCGILSVTDGPTDNPWRVLILSLSNESRAVSHAISSMAAFHGSYDVPSLLLRGTEEMNESSKCLTTEGNMNLVPSLATHISLAFAEGWKSPKSTSDEHLNHARQLLQDNFPTEQGFLHLTTQDAARFKYLITSFVYIHVIFGITCPKDQCPQPLPERILSFLAPTLSGTRNEIDPLLGCATSIFPLVDKAVFLANKVRRSKRNSLSIVSQASELHIELQNWKAPNISELESFGELQYSLQHCIQTAEALRYATLLHLHQAVPEVPSATSEELARKVLLKLAIVPSTSRMTNLHIFPLLVASCELTDEEDREWARQRWEAMISRLRIRNVECCWEIVQATWARRDNEGSKSYPSLANNDPELDEEYTIRGKLHWLNVMYDQKWKVFAG